jgi:hypothetical protein
LLINPDQSSDHKSINPEEHNIWGICNHLHDLDIGAILKINSRNGKSIIGIVIEKVDDNMKR